MDSKLKTTSTSHIIKVHLKRFYGQWFLRQCFLLHPHTCWPHRQRLLQNICHSTFREVIGDMLCPLFSKHARLNLRVVIGMTNVPAHWSFLPPLWIVTKINVTFAFFLKTSENYLEVSLTIGIAQQFTWRVCCCPSLYEEICCICNIHLCESGGLQVHPPVLIHLQSQNARTLVCPYCCSPHSLMPGTHKPKIENTSILPIWL